MEGHRLLAVRHLATMENERHIYMGQGEYSVKNPYERIDTEIIQGAAQCVLLTSPLTRALQTAEAIRIQRQDVKWSYEVLEGIKERGLGVLEGQFKDSVNNDPQYFDEYRRLRLESTPPDAESFKDFLRRIDSCKGYILELLNQNDVLLVTHLQVIRALICILNKMDYSNWYSIRIPYGKVVQIYEQ